MPGAVSRGVIGTSSDRSGREDGGMRLEGVVGIGGGNGGRGGGGVSEYFLRVRVQRGQWKSGNPNV